MKTKILSVSALSALGATLLAPAAFAANGNDTWLGNTDANWATAANWSPAVNAPPITGDWLFFGPAGSSGTLLTNNLANGTSLNGLTFNSGASGFTLLGNPLVLAGGITNNNSVLQTISLPITNTASRTISTTAGGGNVTINGGVFGTGGAFTILGGGTLTLGGTNGYTGATTMNNATLVLAANNVLATNNALNVLGPNSYVDLAGFSQTVTAVAGTDLGAGVYTPSGTYITNTSATLATLTITNYGNDYQFRQGNLGGNVRLVLSANNLNNSSSAAPSTGFQFQAPGNTYSGGTVVQGIGTTPFTTTNLAAGGGYATTGNTNTAVMRFYNNNSGFSVFGSGPITLDNGELWATSGYNFTNPIAVTARGGIFRVESTVSGGGLITFSAPLTGSGLFALCDRYAANVITFSNNLSGFTGTLAVDTASGANISGATTVDFCSNSFAGSLLFWGSGATPGTVQWNGDASQPYTLSFARVNCGVNGGITTVGHLSDGTANSLTYQLGDNTATTNLFGGIVQDGSGTVGVTKIGSDTQILSGANTYSGPTAVGGGVLVLNGVNNGSGGYTVSNNATLSLGGSGTLNSGSASVTLNAGGTLTGGGGTIAGLVTLDAGNAAINLQDNGIDSLTLAGGLTLNNGNVLSFDLGSGADSIAITGGALTLNSGTVTVNVDGTGFSAGTYPLITGGNFTSTNGFVLGATPASSSFSYTLVASSGNLALQVAVVVVSPANAWWKGGVDNNWSTADTGGHFNWAANSPGTLSTGAKPGPVTAVTFSATGAASQSTVLGGNFEIASLNITTAGAVGIGGGNSLQIDAGGLAINSGAGNVTLSTAELVLGGSQLWTNSSTGTLLVDAPISGLSALTVGGGSTLFSGTNTHGGTTVINGSLTLSGGGTLGASTAAVGAIGGIINLGGSSQSVGAVALYNGGVISNGVIAGTSYDLESGTVTAVLGGGASVIANKSTPDTVILAANNTFGGQTIISNGILQIGIGGTSGTFNPGTIAISNTATLLFDSTVSQTNNSLISGNGSLTVAGGGLLLLGNQTSPFTGDILVDGSTLAAAGGNNTANANFGPLGSGVAADTITLTNGATLSLLGGNVFGSGRSTKCNVTTLINQNCQLILNANDANILGPVILNGGQLLVGNGYDPSYQGAILLGAVTVGGTNSSIIDTNSGSSSTNNGIMLGAPGTDAYNNLGSLVAFVVNPTGASGPDLTVSASLVDPADSPNVGGLVSGDGGINLQGGGTMLLAAVNPYSGPTLVTAGELEVSSVQGPTGMTNYVAVNDGAALGVTVAGTSQWSPSSLTLGAGNGATLEFTGVSSTSVAPLNPGTLSLAGTTTINIISGPNAVGTYPLANNWDTSGSFTLGSLPANVLAATLDTSTSTINLVVTSVSGPTLSPPPSLTNSVSGGALTLNWGSNYTGYRLQAQTNSLSAGLGANWANWAGATTTNRVTIPINPATGAVFFRLVYP